MYTRINYFRLLVNKKINYFRLYRRMNNIATKYNNNKQVKELFRQQAKKKNLTMKEIAEKKNMLPQQLNNKFNNKRLSFSDLKELCDIIDTDIFIELKDKER